LLLRGAAGKQNGIKLREHLMQRQSHRLGVMFATGIGEHSRRQMAQFAESDFDHAGRQLRQNLVQRNRIAISAVLEVMILPRSSIGKAARIGGKGT